MPRFPQTAVFGQGDIPVGRELLRQRGFQGGTLCGWTAWYRFGRDVSGFPAVLEIPLDGGDGHLKSRSNLGLAMALIDGSYNALA